MQKKLYSWIWKWHFIAGLVSLPIVVLLSVTGAIYLFKDDVVQPQIETLKAVTPEQNRLTYDAQLALVKLQVEKAPEALVIPDSKVEATEFTSGRFSHKQSVFINPFTGELTGEFKPSTTGMHKVRKLHGELLMGGFGTKIVELVASWLIVLLITGLFLFWPRERGIKGLFTIRMRQSKRIFYRDVHAVVGFWFSGILILVLAGGLPWTDIWGGGYKWIQKQTHAGYPMTWHGVGLQSQPTKEALSLDEMLAIGKAQQLEGKVSITLPKNEQSTFSISNETTNLQALTKIHFDQYSGNFVHQDTWEDLGVMIKARLWVMAFHQGQFGSWNWALMLLTAMALTVTSIMALFAYLKRKKRGRWGFPTVNSKFKVGPVLIGTIGILAVLLPVFGLSILLLLIGQQVAKKRKKALIVEPS